MKNRFYLILLGAFLFSFYSPILANNTIISYGNLRALFVPDKTPPSENEGEKNKEEPEEKTEKMNKDTSKALDMIDSFTSIPEESPSKIISTEFNVKIEDTTSSMSLVRKQQPPIIGLSQTPSFKITTQHQNLAEEIPTHPQSEANTNSEESSVTASVEPINEKILIAEAPKETPPPVLEPATLPAAEPMPAENKQPEVPTPVVEIQKETPPPAPEPVAPPVAEPKPAENKQPEIPTPVVEIQKETLPPAPEPVALPATESISAEDTKNQPLVSVPLPVQGDISPEIPEFGPHTSNPISNKNASLEEETVSAITPSSVDSTLGKGGKVAPSLPEEQETIILTAHESRLISLKEEAKQIFVADPKIADVQLATPSSLYVFAHGLGNTQILVTGKYSNRSYHYQISVQSDQEDLIDLIKKTTKETIVIRKIPNGIILDGTVSSAKIAEDIRLIAERYMGGKSSVINQLKIKENVQINLRVKIAEVSRSVVNQVGINWGVLAGFSNSTRIGILSGRAPIDPATNAFSRSTVPDMVSIGGRFVNKLNDISGLLDMLAAENLASILAEPNLITTSGEEASFLVGGEFPYPLTQGIGAAATVTYQFKQYGISLTFTPTVIGDKITLRIRPEVSDLDEIHSIKDQFGNIIPSIRTRRAESTVEVGNGQSLAMAGLLSNETSSAISAFPGLGDIPILGALFRSNNFRNDKTELVIVVTPYIVKPTDSAEKISLPTQGLQFANLSDMVFERRITRPNPRTPEYETVVEAGTAKGCNVPTPPKGQGNPALSGDSGFYF